MGARSKFDTLDNRVHVALAPLTLSQLGIRTLLFIEAHYDVGSEMKIQEGFVSD